MFKPRMLSGRHLRVWESRTVEEFKREVVGFGRSMGFDTVSAMMVVDHSRTHTEFFNVENIPSGYYETFHDIEEGRGDPVMRHCKSSSIPIVWDQETYRQHDRMPLWEKQAVFGLKTGVALALHLPGDRHFFIGLDRDKPIDMSERRLTAAVAETQLFAVHAHEAAIRIFMPAPSFEAGAELTPRELEALRWTMDGQTAAEVGESLNISTRTAVFHLRNATLKMGCRSKYQAILKAIEQGLLS